jgi:hypothetical protein
MKKILIFKILTFVLLVATQEDEDKSWLKSWAHLTKYSHDDYDPYSPNNNFVDNNFEYNLYREEDPQCCGGTNTNDALYDDNNFVDESFGGKTFVNDVDKNVGGENLVDDNVVDINSVDKTLLDENSVTESDLRKSSAQYGGDEVEGNEYFRQNSEWEFGSKWPDEDTKRGQRKRIKYGCDFFLPIISQSL